ncbi:MAG: methyltransferase domain-containing protein [Nanoarchaeota archaeon]
MPIQKILFTKEGTQLYVKDTSKDFHTQYGFIKANDLKKKNGFVKTNTGKELSIIEPYFIDLYKRIKRAPQIISLKDLGIIISETGINSKSRVVDAGCGSGALACFLANIVKEVISYEIREDFLRVAEENKSALRLKNLKIVHRNIYENIEEKNIQLITLDLPEPWLVLSNAEKSLKHGGFIASYSPSIPQTIDFVNTMKKNNNFVHTKTIEMIEREWEIEERRVRPKTTGIMHTGFLSFGRRV